MLKSGDRIKVEALKADGQCYRWWETTIETCGEHEIVTISPAGWLIMDAKRGRWFGKHILRSYYWFDQPYNLIEVFEPDGRLLQIYINLASKPWLEGGVLRFIDHELDVSAYPPAAARLVDEDEFAEAIEHYGYTPEFQREMYAVAAKTLEIADHWQAKAPPTFGDFHVE
jgi:protein associated with RNAse G/E